MGTIVSQRGISPFPPCFGLLLGIIVEFPQMFVHCGLPRGGKLTLGTPEGLPVASSDVDLEVKSPVKGLRALRAFVGSILGLALDHIQVSSSLEVPVEVPLVGSAVDAFVAVEHLGCSMLLDRLRGFVLGHFIRLRLSGKGKFKIGLLQLTIK